MRVDDSEASGVADCQCMCGSRTDRPWTARAHRHSHGKANMQEQSEGGKDTNSEHQDSGRLVENVTTLILQTAGQKTADPGHWR